jgi:hypothetical protein
MTSMRKTTTALLCAALLASMPATAHADEVYPIYFPLVGDFTFPDTYGAPRGGGRTHIGIDIMAPKMTPVIAAADGTVGWVSATCCALQLRHPDGYESWYIHLNNDTPGTDDGLGWGIAPGVVSGASVTAGQIIGWVGDSGNAENVGSHLHFELHNPTGPFNPYESLLAATPLDPTNADEVFFYRSGDGAFRYYRIAPNGSLGSPIIGGTGYSIGWDSITAIDLDGDGNDEQFFYRSSDGAYRFYDINPDGSLGSPILGGVGYSVGWDAITAIDIDGDGQDEMFFYRSTDGAYRYYDIRPNAQLGSPILGGGGYSLDWESITAVDLDGDGQDEMFFYRSTDGAYRFYDIKASASLGLPIQSGVYETGWNLTTAIDLEGDGSDEMFFYRANGEFAYHDMTSVGTRGETILAGSGYSSGWSSITSINLNP